MISGGSFGDHGIRLKVVGFFFAASASYLFRSWWEAGTSSAVLDLLSCLSMLTLRTATCSTLMPMIFSLNSGSLETQELESRETGSGTVGGAGAEWEYIVDFKETDCYAWRGVFLFCEHACVIRTKGGGRRHIISLHCNKLTVFPNLYAWTFLGLTSFGRKLPACLLVPDEVAGLDLD